MSERALAMETVLSTVAVTARELQQGHAPRPGVYAAQLTVFGALSALSKLYQPAEGFAAAFGGLVVLAEFINPGGPARWLIGIFTTAAARSATPAAVTSSASTLTPTGSDQVIAAVSA